MKLLRFDQPFQILYRECNPSKHEFRGTGRAPVNGVKIVIRRKANGIFSFQIENIESTFIRGSQPSEDLCIWIPWMRRNIHVVTSTERLTAECFKRAQLFSSSPSLGPRSSATRSVPKGAGGARDLRTSHHLSSRDSIEVMALSESLYFLTFGGSFSTLMI